MKKNAALVVILTVLVVGFYFGSKLVFQKDRSTQIYRVGVLSALDYFYPTIDAFKQRMTELGYVEGDNIFYDIQKGPTPVGNQSILKKFVQDKVDLILVFPTEASLEAKEVTAGTGIPVIVSAAFVEGNGLIESIRHPGGNLTGVRFPIAEVATKRLEILHEIAPNIKRVWVPYLKDYPTVAPSLKALDTLARSIGITIIGSPFSTPLEMMKYLSARTTGNHDMDAILLVPEPVSIIPAFSDQVYAFANTYKIPVAGVGILDSDLGPIFSFIPTGAEFGRLLAPLADKIFRGELVGSIPVVTPESELEINYRAIKRLGLTVNEGLLGRAKKVIR